MVWEPRFKQKQLKNTPNPQNQQKMPQGSKIATSDDAFFVFFVIIVLLWVGRFRRREALELEISVRIPRIWGPETLWEPRFKQKQLENAPNPKKL